MKLMKNNLVKLILLFVAFVVTVLGIVLFLCLKIHWTWKIFGVVVGVILSFIEFISIQKLNKNKPVVEVIEKKELTKETEEIKYSSKHLLCPKCFKPFDGNNCFYCGYVKKEK